MLKKYTKYEKMTQLLKYCRYGDKILRVGYFYAQNDVYKILYNENKDWQSNDKKITFSTISDFFIV